ncbi:AIR carboxylase family protein [Phototrophicus methaneseepsis]|uniref:Phosphoribosylaminoimidazole carboxylase n=1 Tax=Phototrophicus methaneseepsis TaxID=2710758 RepID=A0A7S8EAD9_9CHLR|nr:AIR carboxylase family protein [Phototrophicus methaneseepsis]QPC83297.1 AIR carboxylase family protein [Phototrophicus methaneseepsis]
MTEKAIVPILMGSRSDMSHAEKIGEALAEFGIAYEYRVGSAHKTPVHVLDLLKAYENDPRPKVYITIAGRSNALSGFTDGVVNAPVIACPPVSSSFGGADIYSSLRMPSGVAPAVVLEPTGAALLAAKIIALFDADVREKLVAKRLETANVILQDDRDVSSGDA